MANILEIKIDLDSINGDARATASLLCDLISGVAAYPNVDLREPSPDAMGELSTLTMEIVSRSRDDLVVANATVVPGERLARITDDKRGFIAPDKELVYRAEGNA